MAKYVILLYFYVSLFQKHKKYKNIKSKNVGKVFLKKNYIRLPNSGWNEHNLKDWDQVQYLGYCTWCNWMVKIYSCKKQL